MNTLLKPPVRLRAVALGALLGLSVAAVFDAAGNVALASTQSAEVTRSPDGIAYISGGVGEESIERLKTMTQDFNLKLVFTLQSGAYLSDIPVRISAPAKGTLIEARSEGPWFMAKLPAGNYVVEARVGDDRISRQVSVGEGLRTIHLRWAQPETTLPDRETRPTGEAR